MPLLRFLIKIGINDCSVLSLGCASGNLEEVLEKYHACKVFGLDNSANAINETKKLITSAAIIDLEMENITDVVCGKKFDIVLLADVLEHLRNPIDILKQCQEILLPEGRIIVSIPNIANWSVRFSLLCGQFEYSDTGILDRTHIKFYTLKTAKELLHKSGFCIIAEQYSTSIINMLYLKMNQHNAKGITIQKNSIKNKNSIRRIVSSTIRKIDELLTSFFPGMFAQQFMFAAVQMSRTKIGIKKRENLKTNRIRD